MVLLDGKRSIRELLSLGGHYARMFKEQEYWYK